MDGPAHKDHGAGALSRAANDKAPDGRFFFDHSKKQFWRANTRYLLVSPLAGCIRRLRAHRWPADSFRDRRLFNDHLLVAPRYRWWLRQILAPFFYDRKDHEKQYNR
jgi:hypothetical protein